MRKYCVVGFFAFGFILITAFTNNDDSFLNKASRSNLAEIQAGKLAISKGSGKIREYANKMVADHRVSERELLSLAKKQHVQLSNQPDSRNRDILDSLKNLSGKAFDDAYVNIELQGHQAALALFSDEAEKGLDPDLRVYAGKNLPVLKMHLEMFRGSSSTMRMSVDSTKKK